MSHREPRGNALRHAGRGLSTTLVALAAAILVLGSCNPGAPEDTQRRSPEPEANTFSPATTRLALSLRDHGATRNVDRGTKIQLVLAGGFRWSTPTSDGAELDIQELISDSPDEGQTWELQPKSRGEAVLRSTGTPNCRPNTPGCPSGNRDYMVTLVIS